MTAWRFLFLSLVAHLVAWFLLKHQDLRLRGAQPETIEVSIVDTKARTFARQASPPLNQLKPANPLFASEFDQTVQKQTRAIGQGTANRRTKKGDAKKRQANSASQDSDGLTPQLTGRDLRNLGEDLLQEEVGSRERLDGVEKGPMTFLNTERFVYYSFFARIEDRIYPLWRRELTNVENRLTSQQLSRVASREWVTDLEVLIDQQGNYLESVVHQDSGLPGLDEAAINAFKEARFFPNPPRGMIKADGKIHLRVSFHLTRENLPRPWARPE